MDREFYTANEWGDRIASLGRLVDIRNFPDVAAEVLLGNRPAYLGRGSRLQTKRLDPSIIPAVVFWTKGPPELLVENESLLQALITYLDYQAVIGLQLTVTGFGGTFVEPGIGKPEDIAQGLTKVLASGLIDPEAVIVRYDPLMRISIDDSYHLTNASVECFEKVMQPIAELGVRFVETKFLLSGDNEKSKYQHVTNRMKKYGIESVDFTPNEIQSVISELDLVAQRLGMTLSTCCIKQEQKLDNWQFDQGCLSAERLTSVGKKVFGPNWNRLSFDKRSSRTGCLCSAYWDLSNIKGHKKCGGDSAACLYCTASKGDFAVPFEKSIESEKLSFMKGQGTGKHKCLLVDDPN